MCFTWSTIVRLRAYTSCARLKFNMLCNLKWPFRCTVLLILNWLDIEKPFSSTVKLFQRFMFHWNNRYSVALFCKLFCISFCQLLFFSLARTESWCYLQSMLWRHWGSHSILLDLALIMAVIFFFCLWDEFKYETNRRALPRRLFVSSTSRVIWGRRQVSPQHRELYEVGNKTRPVRS